LAFGYLLAHRVSGMAVYESKQVQLILNRISGNREVTPEMQNQLKSV
jgi:hypothetical protein